MALYEIPIDNTEVNQRFQIVLKEQEYHFEIRYNNRLDRWVLAISDKDNNYIFQGLTIVLGIDYFSLINDARLPENAELRVIDYSRTATEPNRTNFGLTHKLMYLER